MTTFGETDHFTTTSEMHFIAPYYRYDNIHTLSKQSDKIATKRWPDEQMNRWTDSQLHSHDEQRNETLYRTSKYSYCIVSGVHWC